MKSNFFQEHNQFVLKMKKEEANKCTPQLLLNFKEMHNDMKWGT